MRYAVAPACFVLIRRWRDTFPLKEEGERTATYFCAAFSLPDLTRGGRYGIIDDGFCRRDGWKMEKNATHVIMIRHGESRGNAEGFFSGQTDIPLTPRGIRQAERRA